jgi:hypothetical protein
MVGSDQKQIVEANGDFQNKQWSESMFANLQEVQIKDIGFYSNEMFFIELVLSKARLLSRLSIRLDVECLIPKEEVLDVLLKYSKASPNVEVGLEGKVTSRCLFMYWQVQKPLVLYSLSLPN